MKLTKAKSVAEEFATTDDNVMLDKDIVNLLEDSFAIDDEDTESNTAMEEGAVDSGIVGEKK